MMEILRFLSRFLAVLILCLPLMASDSASQPSQNVIRQLLHKLESFTSPGPLSSAHQSLDNAQDCTRCHSEQKGLEANRCLACHSEIDERMRQRLGYHGKIEQDCHECHTEHEGRNHRLVQLDTSKFDHDQAQFPLIGDHASVTCEACHAKPSEVGTKRTQYIGLPLICEDCHPTPHGEEFVDDCLRCHSEQGWKRPNLKFDHQTVKSFPLTGKHQRVDCAQCHPDMHVFNNRPTDCASCHPSPHQGQFEEIECETCHQPSGWTGKALKFDHNRDSRFPLEGKHADVACANCHPSGQYETVQTRCQDCHEDVHKGNIKKSCEECHTPSGFTGENLKFDHNRQTPFALTGLHGAADCRACHVDTTFSVQGETCETCHDDVEQFYAGTSFAALAAPKPDPMHGLVKCTNCHALADPKASAELIRPRCINCHNAHYGLYLDESHAVIESQYAQVTSEKPSSRSTCERIRRLAPHNLSRAYALLQVIRQQPQQPVEK